VSIYVNSPNALVVYGHVGFDVSTIAGSCSRTLGGAAYYAALGAATHGVNVELASVLGSDFPTEQLRHPRLDISSCIVGNGPAAVFAQTYDEDNNVIHLEAELNVCTDLRPTLMPLEPLAPGAVMLTTAPPPQQMSALDWLRSREFDGLIAIDTALAYVGEFQALLSRTDLGIGLLFVNEAEYEHLAPSEIPSERVVVKRGAQGASLLERGAWTHVSAPAVKHVSTVTGAGDVLAGAFLASHLNGQSSVRSLEEAVTLASSYVENGPECFFRDAKGKSG